MAAIADIEDAELALLDLLVAWRLGESGDETAPVPVDIPAYSHSQSSGRRWSVGQRRWYVHVIQTYRPRLTPLIPSLIGTLQGHGLVTYESNVDNRDSIIAESHNPELMRPYVEPTQLGELVWMRFDGAGAHVPHVWTSPAASSRARRSISGHCGARHARSVDGRGADVDGLAPRALPPGPQEYPGHGFSRAPVRVADEQPGIVVAVPERLAFRRPAWPGGGAGRRR